MFSFLNSEPPVSQWTQQSSLLWNVMTLRRAYVCICFRLRPLIWPAGSTRCCWNMAAPWWRWTTTCRIWTTNAPGAGLCQSLWGLNSGAVSALSPRSLRSSRPGSEVSLRAESEGAPGTEADHTREGHPAPGAQTFRGGSDPGQGGLTPGGDQVWSESGPGSEGFGAGTGSVWWGGAGLRGVLALSCSFSLKGQEQVKTQDQDSETHTQENLQDSETPPLYSDPVRPASLIHSFLHSFILNSVSQHVTSLNPVTVKHVPTTSSLTLPLTQTLCFYSSLHVWCLCQGENHSHFNESWK